MKKDGLGSVSLGSTTPGPPENDEEKFAKCNQYATYAINVEFPQNSFILKCIFLCFIKIPVYPYTGLEVSTRGGTSPWRSKQKAYLCFKKW